MDGLIFNSDECNAISFADLGIMLIFYCFHHIMKYFF